MTKTHHPAPNQATPFRAIADHLEAHPGLPELHLGLLGIDTRFEWEWRVGNAAGALQWAATLTAPAVRLHRCADASIDVAVTGRTTTNRPVLVKGRDYTDALTHLDTTAQHTAPMLARALDAADNASGGGGQT
ncbi:hypothetical protein [Prauserella alba]|uniref:SCP-2 sterol transfer family protein n=1 Tax=Prauserella alba TaxID=176898 RepID=A0ABP4G8N7_9PSEU|nr:hypothetical protein [Prauserella alba]MCP2180026.1 hypothetical protein [Prauserella alba]